MQGIYTQRRSDLLDADWLILTSRNVTFVLDESRSRVVFWRCRRICLPFMLCSGVLFVVVCFP